MLLPTESTSNQAPGSAWHKALVDPKPILFGGKRRNNFKEYTHTYIYINCACVYVFRVSLNDLKFKIFNVNLKVKTQLYIFKDSSEVERQVHGIGRIKDGCFTWF